jgi:hypothetical protein
VARSATRIKRGRRKFEALGELPKQWTSVLRTAQRGAAQSR